MMKLDVLMDGELAGTLSYTAQTHRYAFRYSPAWLSRKARYALGPTLPLELDEAMTEERHSALVRQFFENLLPEGHALDDAASTHKLSKGNLMGLLAALGGETAGALPRTDLRPCLRTRLRWRAAPRHLRHGHRRCLSRASAGAFRVGKLRARLRASLPPGEHRACAHGPARARRPAKGQRGCAGRRGGAQTHRAVAHLGCRRVRAPSQHGTRGGEGRSIPFLSRNAPHREGQRRCSVPARAAG